MTKPKGQLLKGQMYAVMHALVRCHVALVMQSTHSTVINIIGYSKARQSTHNVNLT